MVEKQTSAEKVCTISGPVLDPEDKFFHGLVKSRVEVSIQIPSRFWKIIITNKGGKPQAFGFVLEQDVSGLDLHEELIVPDAWKKFMKPLKEIEGFFDGLATLGPILKWDQFKKV
jgi:endonuclease G